MENKDQNMELLDAEALKNASGGSIQEAYEYLEELRQKYQVVTYAQVRDIWTEEEESKFNALLHFGVSEWSPYKNPQNPNIPIGGD